jgi:RNA polymerase sigma factor (sigma-70 family)
MVSAEIAMERSALPASDPPLEMQSTLDLLERARSGDERAWNVVFRRCTRGLRRFAAGRLPPYCRGMNDTEDLVQDTVVNALRRIEFVEITHEGALLAYLRQAVLRRIIDEVRKRKRRPLAVSLPDDQADQGLSPLDQVIGGQNVERYEAALSTLRPRDRDAIVMRLEQQATYDAMAAHFALPTANAARVAVKRALFRLAHAMAAPPPHARRLGS